MPGRDAEYRRAQHKKIYFRAGWADYDKAVKGTLSLIPNHKILKKLKNDYNKMHAMFYGDAASWDTIIDQIKVFESKFNSGA